MSWSLSHLFSIVAGSAVAQKMLEAVASKGAEVGAEAVKERVKSDEEWRDEMYAHWVHTSIASTVEEKKTGAENLIRQHRLRSERVGKEADAAETLMMHSLGKAWFHLNDSPKIRDNFFYLGLGQMDDAAFEVALDALHDDKIQQWVRRIAKVIESAYGKGEGWAIKLFNRTLDALTGAEHLETVTDKLSVIFSDAVQIADTIGAVAFKGVNKLLLGAESLVDKVPGPKRGRHQKVRK